MNYPVNASRSKRLNKRMNAPMYQMLAASGELETLKSHIRSRLIHELNKNLSKTVQNEDRPRNKYTSLASRLIISHLRAHQCEYTLSVFVPECGLSPAEVYCLGRGGNAQLLDTEKLLPEIELLKREPAYEAESQDYSPLEFMLQYFEHQFAHSPVCAGIQTEEDLPFQFYDERLLDIDRVFETRRCVNLQSTKETVEHRMEQMRSEMEIQFREKLNYEMDRFRTSKMLELKEQMDEKYHRMLQDSEKKLREDYERQIANLSEHHKQMQKQTELTRQADEREAFLRRQSLQTEVESLRTRLAELKEEKEQLLRKRREMEAHYSRRQTEIDLHEKELKEREQCFENQVQMEVRKLRIDDEQRILHREKELEYKASELEDCQKKLEHEKDVLKQLKSDLLEQKSKISDMEIADYTILKSQNDTLKTEVDILHGQLNTALKTVQEQKRQLAMLQVESAAYQAVSAEAENLRAALSNTQKQFGEERIQLSNRIMEQKMQMERILKQLTLTETDVFEGVLPSSEQSNSSQGMKLAHGKPFVGIADPNAAPPAAFQAINITDPWSDRLQESKKRMQLLQAESDQLESAYDRWSASNPASLFRLEYEKLVNSYLAESKAPRYGIPATDFTQAVSVQTNPTLQATHEKGATAPSENTRLLQRKENQSSASPKEISKVKAISTSIGIPNGGGISLVYDDTGVSAHTHTSRSEISLEIDDRFPAPNGEHCPTAKSVGKSSVESNRTVGVNHGSLGSAKLSDKHNSTNGPASGKVSYRDNSEADNLNTENSTDISECIEEPQAENLRPNEDAQSTDDENTTFDVEGGVTKERTVEENVVGGDEESIGSKTPEPQSNQTADRSGANELMRRYLELSKTTNRVSEALRLWIEELLESRTLLSRLFPVSEDPE